MQKNPFTLSFGKRPIEYIQQPQPIEEIVDAFTSEVPAYQVAMLTGMRGSGKTVMLTSISKKLEDYDDWYVMELNPERDMLQSMLSKLYSLPGMKKSMEIEKIDLSFFGIGIGIKSGTAVTDIEDAIKKLLIQLQKKKKKLLITVDEAVNNKTVREFASSFQIMMRSDLPIFLIMTGLFKNISNLQNAETLTFLYRAPKFEVMPLSMIAIAKRYEKALEISYDLAVEYAKLTNGYPFAFQVLGHILFDHKGHLKKQRDMDKYIMQMTEQLEIYVYEKVWSELSETDQKICYDIAVNEGKKVKDIRQQSQISSSMFARYRDRLAKIGLINTKNYGTVTFALPFFAEFVIKNSSFGL